MGFIKVCGMTDSSAVSAALAAGVDAIGFVFAPSVRRVTPEQAARLAGPARGKVLCVAVTQHPDTQLLQEIFAQFRPDVLQTDEEDLPSISFPPGVAAWPVLRGLPSSETLQRLQQSGPLLFEGPRSGTGKVADWAMARDLATGRSLILAGGLSHTNVAEAISTVRPFGVDVSSGVEESPGRKSPALIESFVTRARAAFSAHSGSGEH
jgi:phosphoribosylanthranilate isomerase